MQKDRSMFPTASTAFANGTQRIKSSADLIVVSQQDHNGLYRFNVDLVYHFGLTLPLLLSEAEAAWVMSIAKVNTTFSPLRQPSDIHSY